MRKELLLVSFVALATSKAGAQVDEVSVIVSPTIGYNWFDSKSTVENGVMYGVQAGFGFGKVIELRALYERSANLKQRFGHYEEDIQNVIPNFQFTDRNVVVSRIGGEFKTNIPVGGFSPYILLGTGVQTFERKFGNALTYKNQNLYGSAGIGFKINMGNRITLNLEGRGLVYNMNPGSLLIDPNYVDDPANPSFGNWIGDQDRNRMYNWSATAGLQIYFGGRNNDELTTLDKAYLKRFSGGVSGFKVTLAPVASFVDFNNKSSYRNTYLLGGQLGVDITDFVGLRGYYMQATEGENPSFDFDKLAMYGIDFVGKLNVARGIVPYITVGGGYINVQDEYKGRALSAPATSGYYAKGGVGLDVPLGKYVDVFGAANLLYTVEDNKTEIAQLRSTDQLRQHTMYNVGLRLKLGKNANTVSATQDAFDNRFAGERSDYNRRIKALESELKEAYNNNDIEKVTQIMEEKKTIETKAAEPVKSDLIRMTPAELESLIDKVIQGVENENTPTIENRLDRLERLLINMNQGGQSSSGLGTINQQTYAQTYSNNESDYKAINDRLLNEINKLNQQLENQKKNIDQLNSNQAALAQQQVVQQPQVVQPTTAVVNQVTTTPVNSTDIVTGAVLNKGLGLFLGPNFGDATTFNVGIRSFHGFTNSPIVFMPEAYVALGDVNGFGLSANAIIPFNIRTMPRFSPYAGLGLGLNLLGKELSFNPNFIAGAAYKIGVGSAFVDYTVRGAFKNNQLAFGYRFRF